MMIAKRPERIAEELDWVQANDWIYPRGPDVVYESVAETQCPNLDIPYLCDLLADNNFDWRGVREDYIEAHIRERGG